MLRLWPTERLMAFSLLPYVTGGFPVWSFDYEKHCPTSYLSPVACVAFCFLFHIYNLELFQITKMLAVNVIKMHKPLTNFNSGLLIILTVVCDSSIEYTKSSAIFQ